MSAVSFLGARAFGFRSFTTGSFGGSGGAGGVAAGGFETPAGGFAGGLPEGLKYEDTLLFSNAGACRVDCGGGGGGVEPSFGTASSSTSSM